jgi:hypothetical protein
MEMRANVAILYASPGSFTDAGGFWLTPNGVVPIPPNTPKIREAFERAVAQCLAMRDPDFLPGPTPKPHTELKAYAEKTVVALAKALAAPAVAGPVGGTIIFQNLLTGTYIFIDADGVHFEKTDPRLNGFVAATQTWLAAEKIDNRGLAAKVQELVVPFMQEYAAKLTPMVMHA